MFLSRQNFISTVATKWKTLCFQEHFLLPECAKYTHFLPEVFWKKVQWSWPFLYLGKEVHFLGHFGAPNWSFQCHFLSAGTPPPAKRSSLLATKIFVIKSFQVAGHICALEHECAIMHSCGIKLKKKGGGGGRRTQPERKYMELFKCGSSIASPHKPQKTGQNKPNKRRISSCLPNLKVLFFLHSTPKVLHILDDFELNNN